VKQKLSMHGYMHNLFIVYNNYYKSMAKGKVLSWRMGSCKVKPDIYAACQIANNWSPKNIRSYMNEEIASSRDGRTMHGRRRVKSSLLLHQKLRPADRCARAAGIRITGPFRAGAFAGGDCRSPVWRNLEQLLALAGRPPWTCASSSSLCTGC